MITNMSGEFQLSSNDIQIPHDNVRHLQLKFKHQQGNTHRNSDIVG